MPKLITYNDWMNPKPEGFVSRIDYSEFSDWFVAPIQIQRDSETLEESNWEVFTSELEKDIYQNQFEIHRHSHFACGWFEFVLIKPNSEAFKYLEKINEDLDNYPVLDEEHFCNLEHEQIMQSIQDNAGYDLRSLMEKDHFLEKFESQFSENQLIEIVQNCYYDGIVEAIEGYVYLEDKFEDIKEYILKTYFEIENLASVNDGSNMINIFLDWYKKDIIGCNDFNQFEDQLNEGNLQIIINDKVLNLINSDSGIDSIQINL